MTKADETIQQALAELRREWLEVQLRHAEDWAERSDLSDWLLERVAGDQLAHLRSENERLTEQLAARRKDQAQRDDVNKLLGLDEPPPTNAVKDLRTRLGKAELAREAAERQLKDQQEAHLRELENRQEAHRCELENRQEAHWREIENLQEAHWREIENLRHEVIAARQGADAEELNWPETVDRFVDLRSTARQWLHHIVIPKSAERDLKSLDQAEKSSIGARKAWDSLRALNEYAQRRGDFRGGFKEWCDSDCPIYRWNSNALAMNEGKQVMKERKLRDTRLFGISGAVTADKKIIMQPHLKIQEGGGENIPRIYFYDDTRGDTGKVHIGFIGPHRLVPNTLTPNM